MFGWFYDLFYRLAGWVCNILGSLYNIFETFAGLVPVTYAPLASQGDTYLSDVFFQNSVVTRIYWGMAIIGIVFAFGFAIVAAVRKMLDLEGKQQRSYTAIFTSLFKCILIMLCLNAIVGVVFDGTSLLMRQINLLVNTSKEDPTNVTKTYSDEEYATMSRALNTIGNYSMNPSYNSRINLNKCYNEIRNDLRQLESRQVFAPTYAVFNGTTEVETIVCWQSSLQAIAQTADLSTDLPLNHYSESVSNAILATMKELRTNPSFAPLKSFKRNSGLSQSVPLDRALLLMGGLEAAWNEKYNESPSMDDALRNPYYVGQKDVYDPAVVNADFDLSFSGYNYFIVIIAALCMSVDFLTICLASVARIFNMLVLYLLAPPIIASMPMDDGAKFKQWMLAFVVQSFSVFGTIMAIQLLLLFLPIIFSAELVFFDPAKYAFLNMVAKLLLAYACTQAAKRSHGLITGILADSAGWQSISAGDMSSAASQLYQSTLGTSKKVASAAGSLAWKPVSWAGGKVGGAIKNAWDNRNKGPGGSEYKGGGGGGAGGGSGGAGSVAEKLPDKQQMPAGSGSGSSSGSGSGSGSGGVLHDGKSTGLDPKAGSRNLAGDDKQQQDQVMAGRSAWLDRGGHQEQAKSAPADAVPQNQQGQQVAGNNAPGGGQNPQNQQVAGNKAPGGGQIPQNQQVAGNQPQGANPVQPNQPVNANAEARQASVNHWANFGGGGGNKSVPNIPKKGS